MVCLYSPALFLASCNNVGVAAKKQQKELGVVVVELLRLLLPLAVVALQLKP